MSSYYKRAGVDIDAGEKTVESIKDLVKSTFNKNVITGIGHFGAFYQLDLSGLDTPILVSSVDGVGTKLKVAIESSIHNTIGEDLVNHCVNDIAVCGAKPLYFMDYMAFGKLSPDLASSIISGFAKACIENGVALIGGETAEMPGLYDEKDYDLSGTIVGIVDKKRIIDGSKIKKGDILVGYVSNGLHTNGYSLARTVLLKHFELEDYLKEINSSLKNELLKVHKSYLPLIQKLNDNLSIKAFSHITGGGIISNTKRVIPIGYDLEIDWNSWKIPPIFNLISETGKISGTEMRRVFNMGIGLVAIIDTKDVDDVFSISLQIGEKPIIIGKVI